MVVAAGHMAKGLAKIASWGGFLPGALRDPAGTDTAIAIAAGDLPKPAPLVAVPVLGLASCFALIVLGWGCGGLRAGETSLKKIRAFLSARYRRSRVSTSGQKRGSRSQSEWPRPGRTRSLAARPAAASSRRACSRGTTSSASPWTRRTGAATRAI